MSLGVNAVKGSHRDVFVPIIPKNTPYPMSEPMGTRLRATDGRLIGCRSTRAITRWQPEPRTGVIEFELPEAIDVNTRVDVAFMFDRQPRAARHDHGARHRPGTRHQAAYRRPTHEPAAVQPSPRTTTRPTGRT